MPQNELSGSGTKLDAALLSEAQELIALHDEPLAAADGSYGDDEEPL